jgi:hypothetical protein
MPSTLQLLASLGTISSSNERWECICPWCCHRVTSRSWGVAWLRMATHLGFSDLAPDPSELSEDEHTVVDTYAQPSLVSVDGGDA